MNLIWRSGRDVNSRIPYLTDSATKRTGLACIKVLLLMKGGSSLNRIRVLDDLE